MLKRVETYKWMSVCFVFFLCSVMFARLESDRSNTLEVKVPLKP